MQSEKLIDRVVRAMTAIEPRDFVAEDYMAHAGNAMSAIAYITEECAAAVDDDAAKIIRKIRDNAHKDS